MRESAASRFGSRHSDSGEPTPPNELHHNELHHRIRRIDMKFHSFDELRKMHGVPTGNGIVRHVLSLIAAITIVGGLIMLIPLGT